MLSQGHDDVINALLFTFILSNFSKYCIV